MSTDQSSWTPNSPAEDGVALITALLGVIILAGLAVVFVATATFQSRSTGAARDFETAIHVAEAAIDELLPCVVVNTIPPPPSRCEDEQLVNEFGVTTDVLGEPHEYDLDADASNSEQRVWAVGIAEAADDVLALPRGEGYAIRPQDAEGNPMPAIFSVGWVPDRANAVRSRVVKIQFDVMTGLDVGLLVGGDLSFSGAADILGDNGSVHANGSVTGGNCGNAFYIEQNFTTSSDLCPDIPEGEQGDPCPPDDPDKTKGVGGKCLSGEPPIPIPTMKARDIYGWNVLSSQPWYDLCPDGNVRTHSGTGTPCEGPSIGTGSDQGWQHQPGQNRWRTTGPHAGVFYVYRQNASLQGSTGSVAPMAVIVEAVEGGHGAHSGNISIGGNVRFQSPGLHGLTLLADRDVVIESSASFIRGIISAHEQVKLRGVEIEGAVIAQDVTDTVNSPLSVSTVTGSVKITYDDQFNAFGNRPRITHWNEL